MASGESSSTKMISHSTPASARATRSTSVHTLAASSKVGTMTDSSAPGASRTGALRAIDPDTGSGRADAG